MKDVVFELTRFQLCALALSNFFPFDICILIVKFLKVSEFELSRKEYLIDCRNYREELVRYVEQYYRDRFPNSLSNIPRNLIRYNPSCEFMRVRESISCLIMIHTDFNLKPYWTYNNFGEKYEKVVLKIKSMAKNYQYRPYFVDKTMAEHLVRSATSREGVMLYNFIAIQNNFIPIQNNNITEPSIERKNSGMTRHLDSRLFFYGRQSSNKKRVKKDFRLNTKQSKKHLNMVSKRSHMSFKNSFR